MIICGDSLTELKKMESESVDCCAENKTGNTKTIKNLKITTNLFKNRMTNFTDSFNRRFEENIFFFGSPNPHRSPTKSINILIYDKSSPNRSEEHTSELQSQSNL